MTASEPGDEDRPQVPEALQDWVERLCHSGSRRYRDPDVEPLALTELAQFGKWLAEHGADLCTLGETLVTLQLALADSGCFIEPPTPDCLHPGEHALFQATATLMDRDEAVVKTGATDDGVLTLTTERIVFAGASTAIVMPYAVVRHTHAYADAVQFECHSSSWFFHSFATDAPVPAMMADIRSRSGGEVRILASSPARELVTATIADFSPTSQREIPPEQILR